MDLINKFHFQELQFWEHNRAEKVPCWKTLSALIFFLEAQAWLLVDHWS